MDYGLFTMPSHPPERKLFDGHQWDLQQLRWADELGFSEAWIGEHHTAPWEPHPSPDLLVAQALMQTKRMRIGPGGFLMPYHHPAELANRVAMLDHLAQGRLNFGVAASGLPSDWSMFNVDGMSGQNREMTRESLDIILRLWSDEPEFDYKGKFWHVTKTGTMFNTLRPHIFPFQKPHPPIGVAGLSKGSDTLKLAGERGFWPMSLNLNPGYVSSHWEAVEEGAARSKRTPKRSDWRMVREVFVADTDAEALRLSAGGMMGRMMTEYFLPLLAAFGFTEYLKHDPSVPDSDVTPGVLRQAQLAHRLARHRVRQAQPPLRGSRRLRHAARVLLRLQREPQGLAPLDGAARQGGHAPLHGHGAQVEVDTGSLRPTVVEVSLARLAENFRAIQAAVAPAAVMPIVKANAYGHGLVPVARHLVSLGVRSLGVAFLEEAVALREAGVTVPILVMGGIFGDQIPIFLRHGLTLTASSIDKLKQIDEIAGRLGVTATVHLKIDTGMERIGVHYYNARGLLERAADCRRVQVEGIYSHFANADAAGSGLGAAAARALPRGARVVRQAGRAAAGAPHGQLRRGAPAPREPPRPGAAGHPALRRLPVDRGAADDRGAPGAVAALARGLLQGRHARAPGELRLHVAVRPPGAGGHGPGGLRRRLLPRALQRGPRADPRQEVPGGRAASAWTRSW